jgi:hypothetical protein
MADPDGRERAVQPEDLCRFFVDRANAGDVEELVVLYEPTAVLALPDRSHGRPTKSGGSISSYSPTIPPSLPGSNEQRCATVISP